MDFLKAEIAAKKRKVSADTSDHDRTVTSSRKYVRRGEQASLSVELDEGRRSNASSDVRSENVQREEYASDEERRKDTPAEGGEGEQAVREVFNISNEEAVRRLRAKGEPIRLFDESDKSRRLRLRALELIEERGEKVGQNDFMQAMRGAESSLLSRELNGKKKDAVPEGDRTSEDADASVEREGVGMHSLLDLGLIKRDINKVYPIIYYTLKGLLRDWEQTLADRTIEIRQSHQGKLVAATQVQTAEYLKPLFKQLRHRAVKPDVLARLAEIVHYVQKREYRHANDSYLQLSIGNAPWPIGVTMVGIHERSGREKIFSSNVAHVLNDEVSRKYIQSLKRLMTFAQTKYPPENVSMLMG